MFFFTVEADEAWTMMSTMHAFGVNLPQTSALANPTITTGGVHFLVHGLISKFSDSMIAHRAASLVFLVMLAFLVEEITRYLAVSRALRVSGIALFTGIPVFILQAALATGEIIATTFLIGGIYHFIRYGRRSISGALISGLIIGSACATRISLAFVLPMPALLTLIFSKRKKRDIIITAVVIVTAALVTVVSDVAYLVSAHATSLWTQTPYLSDATGVGGGTKQIGNVLHHITIANSLLPIALVGVIIASWYVCHGKRSYIRSTPLAGSFLIIGLAGAVVWVIFAPIPHVRYLWPSLACLWLAGTIQLLMFAQTAGRMRARLAVHGIAFATCLYAIASSLLLVSRGESLLLIYQVIGEAPFVLTGEKFSAARDQAELADFVRSRGPDTKFFTFVEPTAYPITYLSGKAIQSIERMPPAGNNYVILVPAHYSIWRPVSDFKEWRKTSTDTAFSRGGFIALHVRPKSGPPPTKFSRAGDFDQF
jgi:hypothetical protein